MLLIFDSPGPHKLVLPVILSHCICIPLAVPATPDWSAQLHISPVQNLGKQRSGLFPSS